MPHPTCSQASAEDEEAQRGGGDRRECGGEHDHAGAQRAAATEQQRGRVEHGRCDDAEHELAIEPGGTAIWNENDDELLDAQLTAFIHARIVKDYAREHMAPRVPMIVLETALAAKFNETILEALGTDAERPAGFDDIEALPQRYVVMPADVAQMKAYIADHTGL